jgi:hypothetical protein
MRCVSCGRRAPLRDAYFCMNIGAIVLRFTWTHQGPTCASCIHGTFWKYTLTTLLVGWLGVISLFLAPIIILGNLFVYATIFLGRPLNDPDEEDEDDSWRRYR